LTFLVPLSPASGTMAPVLSDSGGWELLNLGGTLEA